MFSFPDSVVLALSDGAGGASGGREAAELLLEFVRDRADRLASSVGSAAVVSLLRGVDLAINLESHCGEATGVVAVVRDGIVVGASVGDSEAWLVADGRVTDLTGSQRRRPMIGTAKAEPVGFGPAPLVGRLLLGSDGLFKYVARARLAECLTAGTVDQAAVALSASARLPSGAYQDDVSVIVCEDA